MGNYGNEEIDYMRKNEKMRKWENRLNWIKWENKERVKMN